MVDLRVGFLFLLAVGTMDARQLLPQNPQALEYQRTANQADRENFRSDQLCALCEEYAEIVLEYLTANTTETEIIELLHVICALLGSFEEQCTALVDYFTPILFSELSSIDADTFCQDVGLCREGLLETSLTMKENRCEPCCDTDLDALTRLRNSVTQVDIIRMLLKACNSRNNTTTQCKKTVLAHASSLISSVAQFLESREVASLSMLAQHPSLLGNQRLTQNSHRCLTHER